jgi:hypothetical protein
MPGGQRPCAGEYFGLTCRRRHLEGVALAKRAASLTYIARVRPSGR